MTVASAASSTSTTPPSSQPSTKAPAMHGGCPNMSGGTTSGYAPSNV
jgi:hypothetical protein